MEWLWDTTAAPVLAALDNCPVWWCPTGPLTFLPLHAAGRHNGSSESVFDRIFSSYTPTLRSLAHADRPLAGAEPGRLLVVAVDDLPGQLPLLNAANELELLRVQFPTDRLTVIAGSAATKAAVLGALPNHRWSYFSCHGRQDILNPSGVTCSSPTALSQSPSSSRATTRGDFAFLSACMTATGGLALAEEAVTLAADLHYRSSCQDDLRWRS